MSDWNIEPAKTLKGSLTVPGDKSVSHRALLFAALAEGESRISNLLLGEDVLGTMRLLQNMGVKMSHTPQSLKPGNVLRVQGVGLQGLKEPQGIQDCGNSGTTMRLMLGLLSAQKFDTLLTGDASLNKRPMDRVMDPLKQMGAQFEVRQVEDRRVIVVKGNRELTGIKYQMPVASAQVKSAIILASLYINGETKIIEKTPSRDHTERMLLSMGANLENKFPEIKVSRTSTLKAQDIIVPGDFSSAAFFIVAGLIVPDSQVEIKGVGLNPTRSALIDVLRRMGGKIEVLNERMVSGEPVGDLRVYGSSLKAIKISGAIIPNLIDEIPVFAIAAARAQGQSEVSDAQELRVKESDRIRTLAVEIIKLGVTLTEKRDGFVLDGVSEFNQGSFNSHGDHRIAMSFAVAGLLTSKKSRVQHTECVATSFPGFYELLNSLRI